MAHLNAGEAQVAPLTRHRRPLTALTGIRFFAAVYVVVYHTRLSGMLAAHGLIALANFFASGYLAVALFFQLSGFILAYTYAGQIEKKGDHRRFWEARFARIWPVYMVSLLFVSAVTLSLPRPLAIFETTFMVQAWDPFHPELLGAWNFVCWTLSVEAFFYLCFPLFQVWAEKLERRSQLALIAILLSVCCALNSGAFVLGYPAHGWLAVVPLPLIRLPEFFTGVVMGNYFLRWGWTKAAAEPTGGGPQQLWTWLSAAAALVCFCLPQGWWTSLVEIALAGLLLGLASEQTLLARFLSSRAMILGGGISYSIYLMQYPVKALAKLLLDWTPYHSANLQTGLMFVLLLFISLLTFKGVEEPARKVIRKVFAGVEKHREASDSVMS